MKKNCEQTLELLKGGYLDNELEPPEMQEINLHLETCPACRAAKENLSAIARALRAAPRANPPEIIWPRIAAEISRERVAHEWPPGNVRSRQIHYFTRRVRFTLAAAAALVIIAAGFQWTLSQRGEEMSAQSLTAVFEGGELSEPNFNFGSTIEKNLL